MDFFILDSYLRRVALYDQYESLIWTERYKELGDFELVIRSDRNAREGLVSGARVSINESRRVGTIETVEATVSTDGISMLKVTGRHLETILEDRTARDAPITTGLTTNPQWEISSMAPMDLARYIFDYICVNGTLSPDDAIPFYSEGTIYPFELIPEPTDSISVALDPDSVYNVIKSLADTYNFGFRLVMDNGGALGGTLYFNVYTGNVRTSSQTTFPAVIFSPELDNLQNTSELSSIAGMKNVALVMAPNGSLEVLANEDAPVPNGLDRRVLTVKADDIKLAVGASLTAALKLRGKQELAKYRVILGFDGEVPQNGGYEYEVDYYLGDIVEKRSTDGTATNVRVTEHIRVCDVEGIRSYPTFTLDQLITAGSWYGWDANEHWAEADVTWAEA